MSLIIPPVVPTSAFPPYRQYTNITPFTYRDGLTYLEVLESLRDWLLRYLVPYLDQNFSEFEESWQAQVDALIAEVNAALAAQADAVNNALSEQSAAVASAIADLTAFVNTSIGDLEGKSVEEAIDELTSYVDAVLAQVIADGVELQDPVMAGIFQTPTSLTRGVTDVLYKQGVNVKEFGAKGDGVTDDSVAIQAAIDSDQPVYFSAGVYICHGLIPKTGMRLNGNKRAGIGNGRAVLRTINGDMFVAASYVYSTNIQYLTFESQTGGGDIITGKWAQCKFDTSSFTQYNNGKSAFNVVGWIDNLMQNLSITHTITATVPTFKAISSTGEIAQFTISSCRFTNSGNYSVWLEGQNLSIPINIALRDVNFENAVGGAINLLSARNITLENIGIWDSSVPAVNHFIHIDKSPTTGSAPRSIYISSMVRDSSSAPNAGIKDIFIEPTAGMNDLVLINCGQVQNGQFRVDAGNATGRIFGKWVLELLNGVNISTDAWQPYTPIVSGSGGAALGNGTITGSFQRNGKLINFRARLILGTTTVLGTGTAIEISLPVPTVDAHSYSVLEGQATDTGTGSYLLAAFLTATTISPRTIGVNGIRTPISATSPHTWAATDELEVMGTYEASV